MTTFERLEAIVKDDFDLTLTKDTVLDKLFEDSLDSLDFIFRVERAFDIRLPADYNHIKTGEDLTTAIDIALEVKKNASEASNSNATQVP